MAFLKYLFGWCMSAIFACAAVFIVIFVMSKVSPDMYMEVYEKVIDRGALLPAKPDMEPETPPSGVPSDSALQEESPDIGGPADGASFLAAEKNESEENFEAPYDDDLPYGYDGPNWAVAAEKSDVYGKSGVRTGYELEAGELIETYEEELWEEGSVPVLKFRRIVNGQPSGEEGYVRKAALACFKGPYSRAPDADREIVMKYCGLRGRYVELREQKRREMIMSNPYFSDYKEAREAILKLKNQSDKLTERLGSSVGAERDRLTDTLRKLKIESRRITDEYTETERKYKEWRKKNLGSEKDDFQIPDTPEMLKVAGEMRKLEVRANEICPGI